MGTVNDGVLSLFRGRVGTLVFRRKKNGTMVVCIRPKSKKRKPNRNEREMREKFSIMVNFLKPLVPLLNRTYTYRPAGMSASNKAFSDNYRELLTGDYPRIGVDYSKVILSSGRLPTAKTIWAVSLLQNAIAYVWTLDKRTDKTDRVFLAAYCESLNQWVYKFDDVFRDDCIQSLDVPAFSGLPVHTYIGFIPADGTSASNSVYTGLVNVL